MQALELSWGELKMREYKLEKAAKAAMQTSVIAKIIKDYSTGALDPKVNIYLLTEREIKRLG